MILSAAPFGGQCQREATSCVLSLRSSPLRGPCLGARAALRCRRPWQSLTAEGGRAPTGPGQRHGPQPRPVSSWASLLLRVLPSGFPQVTAGSPPALRTRGHVAWIFWNVPSPCPHEDVHVSSSVFWFRVPRCRAVSWPVARDPEKPGPGAHKQGRRLCPEPQAAPRIRVRARGLLRPSPEPRRICTGSRREPACSPASPPWCGCDLPACPWELSPGVAPCAQRARHGELAYGPPSL